MNKVEGNNSIKGYKVFNPDWTCSPEYWAYLPKGKPVKQYNCPGRFEEDVEPKVGYRGMHFCERLVVCFKDYPFDPKNHVAEVVAYGDINKDDDDRFCTNKLEIVRELPWEEVLRLANIGKNCTGCNNRGNYNTGNSNCGNHNTGEDNGGNYNSGNYNTGNSNSGYFNDGDYNSGDDNYGHHNSGDYNSGDRNSGNRNDGNNNVGDYNVGDYNVGDHNSGDCNTGDHNSGDCNTGDHNSGDCNTGDWNTTSYTSGCFNTVPQHIYLFNKISDWTMDDWEESEAKEVLEDCPPEKEDRQDWWDDIDDYYKNMVKALPNFDPKIFKEITGIDVG